MYGWTEIPVRYADVMDIGGLIESKVRSQVPTSFFSPFIVAENWKVQLLQGWFTYHPRSNSEILFFTTPLEGLTSTGVSPLCRQPRRLSASLSSVNLKSESINNVMIVV